MIIYPRGTTDSEFISCFLERRGRNGETPGVIEIDFTITLEATDLYWQFSRKISGKEFSVGIKSGFNNFFRRKLLQDNSTVFQPNDTLTVSCYMLRKCRGAHIAFETETDQHLLELKDQWPIEEHCIGNKLRCMPSLPSPYQSSSLTRIDAYRYCFTWTIDGVDKIEKTSIRQVMPDYKSIDLSLNLMTDDEYACIEITMLYGYSRFFRCKIAVCTALSCFRDSEEDEYFFHDNDTVWRFKPFLKKNKFKDGNYIWNNSLVLLCEVTASSNNDVSHRENSPAMSGNIYTHDPIKYMHQELLTSYTDKNFSDVTLRTKNQTFNAHKVIICARSSVFRAMFDKDMTENNTGVVEITDVAAEVIDKMLKFMYYGEMEDLSNDQMIQLYLAADKYDVTTLKQKCRSIIKSRLSVSNVCEWLALTDLIEDKDLAKSIENFIFVYSNIILNSKEWKISMENYPKTTSEILYSICLKQHDI